MTAARLYRRSILTLRRLARTNAVRVPALCGAFGVLLLLAIVYVREPAMQMRSGGMAGLGGMPGAAAGTGTLATGDPVAQFSRTRTGQLLFASNISDNCRRVLFDNVTGDTYEVGMVFCGQSQDRPVEVSAMDRLQAVRRSFQKDPAASSQ